MRKSQMDLVLDYFKNNPNRAIKHPEVVDYVTAQWEKATGKKFRDPDRAIRKLHQQGLLQKISKGEYKYDPKLAKEIKSEDFTSAQKEQILKKDNYRCVFCGKGYKEGVELHVDHIVPRDKGGKATIDNGQTLCSEHNILKDNYGQMVFGKKIFIRMRDKAKELNDRLMENFCNDILKVYKKHGIDENE